MTVDTIIDVYRAVNQASDGIRPYQAEVVIKKRGWGTLGAGPGGGVGAGVFEGCRRAAECLLQVVGVRRSAYCL